MEVVIVAESPRGDDVMELLAVHLGFARATSPSCHVHALDLEGLEGSNIEFFTARLDGQLVGIGALKGLGDARGEVKSMHTRASARGAGVGAAMVAHLLVRARSRGYRWVGLETGTQDAFADARRLYARMGFMPCVAFGEYTVNEFSTCMSIDLDRGAAPQR
ncbi:MAG: GNAT family N-acetyltransferase [Ilumatobacteraceae bacterium]